MAADSDAFGRGGRPLQSVVRVVLALVAAGAAAYLTVVQVPADRRSFGVWAATVAIAVAAVASPVVEWLFASRQRSADRRARERYLRIQEYLQAAHRDLVDQFVPDETGDWRRVQVAYHEVRGTADDRRLVRAVDVQIYRPPASNVVWHEGKGVIGMAWATRQDQLWQASRDWGLADGQVLSEDAWGRVAGAARMGLSYPEARQLAERYQVVFAVPAFDNAGGKDVADAEVIGVVSAGMPDRYADQLRGYGAQQEANRAVVWDAARSVSLVAAGVE